MFKKLRVALMAGVLLAFAAAPALAFSPRQRWDLHRLNRVRSAHGVGSLHLGAQLTRRAQYWANHLARLGAISDDIPGSRVCWRTGGHSYGANTAIAHGYSNNLTRDQYNLEHSPPHLANILGGHFRAVGIGIASSAHGLILVQDFCG